MLHAFNITGSAKWQQIVRKSMLSWEADDILRLSLFKKKTLSFTE